MPIPAGGISTVNLDATTDSPASARVELLAAVTQFNQLIASANGVTGMAVLDASGFLAGYGRLVATQTWTGINTFTSAAPLVLSSASPYIQGRQTSVALPNGLWRLHLPGGAGDIFFQKNTAAAGDFTTLSNVLQIGGAQAAFAVPVSAPNAVAAGDLVNKGQLDSKVIGARVSNTGTAVFDNGTPAGWSVTRNSVGLCTITHNLGSLAYSVVASVSAGSFSGLSAHVQSFTTTTFAVQTYSAGALSDLSFFLVFAKF